MPAKTASEIITETETIIRQGYLARSPEECPHPEADRGPYVLWMQGYKQHQRDRNWVAEAADYPYCKVPLRARIGPMP